MRRYIWPTTWSQRIEGILLVRGAPIPVVAVSDFHHPHLGCEIDRSSLSLTSLAPDPRQSYSGPAETAMATEIDACTARTITAIIYICLPTSHSQYVIGPSSLHVLISFVACLKSDSLQRSLGSLETHWVIHSSIGLVAFITLLDRYYLRRDTIILER